MAYDNNVSVLVFDVKSYLDIMYSQFEDRYGSK